MKPQQVTSFFAGLALAAGSLVNCTYTLPAIDGSAGAGGDRSDGGGAGAGGAAPCSTGLTHCKDMCVDTMSDVAHCGTCDKACPAGLPCTQGQCETPIPVCTAGTTKPCYTGPPGTAKVGVCQEGARTCLPNEMEYGPCVGEVVPTDDVCENEVDEDCNGSPAKGGSCLTNAGLVVRYVLDEAAMGIAPKMVFDSAPNPLHLTLDYGSANNMSYTEALTGRGLNWLAPDSSGTASAPIQGTKVFAALNGRTQGTIEVVVKLEAVSGSSSRIFTIGMGVESGRFSLTSNNIDRVQFRWLDNIVAGDWPVDFRTLGRCILHTVVDTTQGNPSDRVRLYLNGMRVTENTGVAPTPSQLIVLGSMRSLYLGNRDEFVRSFTGALYYAALYARPLTDNEIGQHVSYLEANDDK